MRSMALHNYLSMLLMQLYSPQVLLLLASAFLPAAATAMLGFARNLTDLIRRYQPVEMLLGLVRPLLISTYARRRDFASLTRLSQLIYKLSLLTLCPVLVAFTAYGDLFIDVLAKHRYAEAYWLVAGLAWLLVSRSHRTLAGNIANVLDQPQLITRAALANLIVLPVCAAGFAAGHASLSLFAGGCVEEMVGTWILVRGIRALGEPYVPPWPAMIRVIIIGTSLSGLLLLARFEEPSAIWAGLQLAVAGAIAFGLLLASGYFDATERSRLLSLVGRTAG
jgi:O-antigen/teichoic acid export membrane protein